MKELEEIAAAYRALASPAALATVVRVLGSSYRRPGARMLVSAAGRTVAGCVSGGCLEADVAEHARLVIASGEPRVLVYDTLSDADSYGELLLGVGTGCEGIIEILVERLEGDAPEAIWLPLEMSRRDEVGVFTTVYRRGGQSVAEHYAERASSQEEIGVDVFREAIQTPPHLLLCGAGPDSLPLAKLAREILGWRVTVADHRAAYADAARYPSGVQVVVTRPEGLAERVRLDNRTAVVLMTHNYLLDRDLLTAAARSDAFYVGVLGSRKRWQTLDADLQAEGVDARVKLGTRLHAPVGLDIGATSPETIALSVAAEVQAALANHSGGAMRDSIINRSSEMQELDAALAYTIGEPACLRLGGDKPRCLIPLLSD